jgi:glutamate-ammonia-ligase adenylyltransferase
VPDLLVRAPEVLRLLADTSAGRADHPGPRRGRGLAAGHGRPARYPTPRWPAAASLRRHELLRVACADLLGLLPVASVCAALSEVWAAVLRLGGGRGAEAQPGEPARRGSR